MSSSSHLMERLFAHFSSVFFELSSATIAHQSPMAAMTVTMSAAKLVSNLFDMTVYQNIHRHPLLFCELAVYISGLNFSSLPDNYTFRLSSCIYLSE